MKRLKRYGRICWDTLLRFNRNDGSAMAGFIAFSGLLSLFPFLIFAATLIGLLVGEAETDRILNALFDIAPDHVARTIEPVLNEVLNKQSSEILTLSAVFAVFVASNAVDALRIAFDRAYVVHHPKHFLINRARAIGVVFLGAFVAALLGFSIILSPLLLRLARDVAHIPLPGAAGYLSYAFGVLVFIAFVFIMHRVLPGRHMSRTRIWPGVLITTLFWVIAAVGFSAYLSLTPTYTVTYGTLAGVIITLMFFYLTGATIILGAEFNAALNRLQLR